MAFWEQRKNHQPEAGGREEKAKTQRVLNGRVFESPIDREAFIWMKQFSTLDFIAVKSSLVARWAHNPEAVGSNPTAATAG